MRKIEYYLHGIPILWSVGTAVAGAFIGIYDNALLWCWISSKYDQYRWSLFYGPLWLMILLVTYNCVVIWSHVRTIEKTAVKWRIKRAIRDRENNRQEGEVEPSKLESMDRFDVEESEDFASRFPTTAAEEHIVVAEGRIPRGESANRPENTDRGSSRAFNPRLRSLFGSWRRDSSAARVDSGMRRTRKVANQGLLYAGAFYINWIALSVRRW